MSSGRLVSPRPSFSRRNSPSRPENLVWAKKADRQIIRKPASVRRDSVTVARAGALPAA